MSRGALAALALILVVAGLFRFYRLDSVPAGLFPDEAMNGNDAIEALRTGGPRVFYPANGGREGLFINLQAFAIRATGRQDAWTLRAVSALAGTLTVAAFAFLLLELGRASRIRAPETLAVAGAALLATSYWHLTFSRLGFRAILSPLFLCLALALLLRALAKRSLPAAVLAGAAFGFGFHTYIAYRVAPVLLLLFWRRVRETGNARRLVAAFLVAAICFAAPLALHFALEPADFSHHVRDVSVLASPHPGKAILRNVRDAAGMFLVRGDASWIHNIPGRPQLFLPTGVLMLLGIAFAVRRRSLLDAVLVAWLVLGMLPMILASQVPHALRGLLVVPAALGLAASGLAGLFERLPGRSPRWLPNALLVLLLVAQGADTWGAYFHSWARSPRARYAMGEDLNAVVRQMDALPASAEKVVVVRGRGPTMNGVPWMALGIAFLTDSYTLESRAARHVRYMSGEEWASRSDDLAGGSVFFLNP